LPELAGIPEADAFRAHAVGKFDLGAVADVDLDLLPAPDFILNFLARSANGQNACQRIQTGEGLLEFCDQLVFAGFFVLALADVQSNAVAQRLAGRK
jgi:hypothetical protein